MGDGFERDGVEVALELAQQAPGRGAALPGAAFDIVPPGLEQARWQRRLLLGQVLANGSGVGLFEQLGGIGPAVGQQFAQDHAQGIDVGAHVDAGVLVEKLRAHVVRRARGALVAALAGRGFGRGDAEIDDLRSRHAVDLRDQDVAGLEVAVDQAFLVRVRHPLADAHEQFQALAQAKAVFRAEGGQCLAFHVLHGEVRVAVGVGAGLEDLRDGGVLHLRHRLALDQEADFARGASDLLLDQLDRDQALDRLELLGEENLAHAAAAEFVDDAVAGKFEFVVGAVCFGVVVAVVPGAGGVIVESGTIVVASIFAHHAAFSERCRWPCG